MLSTTQNHQRNQVNQQVAITYQDLPAVVDGGYVAFLPLLEIKHVHAVSPATSGRIEVPSNVWVREIQVLVKTMEAYSTGLDGSIHHSLEIFRPETREILPNDDIIIQEEHFVQLGVHFGQVESQVIQHRQILWIPVLQIGITPLSSRLEVVCLCGLNLKLLQYRTVGRVQPLELVHIHDLDGAAPGGLPRNHILIAP